MWHADWFVHCDSCDNTEWMDGKNLRTAKITARKAGWSVSATKALCPKCRPTKYALDAALVAPAEHDTNSVIVPAGEVGSQPRQ